MLIFEIRTLVIFSSRSACIGAITAILCFQVLNETSLWWFNNTEHITPNAVVSAPDKNVTIAKKCSVFPVEFVGELNTKLT